MARNQHLQEAALLEHVIHAMPSKTMAILFFTLITLACLTLLLNSRVFKKTRKERRHTYHIKKSHQVFDKIREIETWQQALSYLRKINPTTFEELLLTSLNRAGIKIKRNSRYTGDGGIDGTAYLPNGQKLIIQAKRYTKFVSKEHIMEFSRVCQQQNGIGLFVHTGRTPKTAWVELPRNIKVISGERLIIFLNNPSDLLRSSGLI